MSAIKGINTNTATPDRMIEFKYDKNELKEKFIDWTASLEDTPLDMALSVITYIEKKYYPVYIFHFNYTASWSATSIYLHTEEYTVYESKTVFVDRYGGEHSQCGTDRIYMNGADRDVPYQAVSKQVPVTKTRTIQNKQPSNGRIFDQRLDIIYNSSANSDFDRWLGSFSLENAVSYSSNKLQNTNIEDSGASYNNAMDYAEKALAIEAKKMCVSQIPGNSYENFSIDCLQKNLHIRSSYSSGL
ncbi:hypothetical protein [Ruminococcus sp. HUN007]|uniref:hypothetical protein n=1 Tax=Ruminococcus sp. HUN007 TaxID=1514668 RepID=UPI0005D146DB|nr:hypothetical protein [Ruminococcus sp. HUN007]